MKRRTTLRLDEDVAARLDEEARRTGRSLKQVVNQAIRLGPIGCGATRTRPSSCMRATWGFGLESTSTTSKAFWTGSRARFAGDPDRRESAPLRIRRVESSP
jgi:hypothetical protein